MKSLPAMMLRMRPKARRIWHRILSCKGLFIGTLLALVITLIVVIPSFFEDDEDGWPKFSDENIGSDRDRPFHKGCVDTATYIADPAYKKMNATYVMLTRNEEIKDVLKTMESIESHFNQWFQYPYVFLNDEPFDEEFKNKVSLMTKSKVEFGVVDMLDWDFPEEVKDALTFKNAVEDQGDRGILYGNMESYHKMCRFYSGLFYKHPMVRKYEWYWRLEPDVEFFCDISYDPFLEMSRHGKKYGFTVLIPEIYWSVPNLFRYTRSFIKNRQIKLGSLWKLFVSNYKILDTDDPEISNWVNFEDDVNAKLSEKVAIEHMFQTGDTEDELGLLYLVQRSLSRTPLLEDKFDDEEYNLCHFWSNFEIARLDVFDNDVYNAYFQYLEKSGGFWRERWGDAPVHSLGLGMTLNVEDIHYFRDIGYRHSIIQHCPKNSNGFDANKKDAEAENGQLPYIEAEERFKRSTAWSKYDKGFDVGCGCRCKCTKGKRDIEDVAWDCMDTWTNLLLSEDSDLAHGGESLPFLKADAIEQEVLQDYLDQL